MQKYAILWNNAESFTAKPHVEVTSKSDNRQLFFEIEVNSGRILTESPSDLNNTSS